MWGVSFLCGCCIYILHNQCFDYAPACPRFRLPIHLLFLVLTISLVQGMGRTYLKRLHNSYRNMLWDAEHSLSMLDEHFVYLEHLVKI
jgi:hypothetical protein